MKRNKLKNICDILIRVNDHVYRSCFEDYKLTLEKEREVIEIQAKQNRWQRLNPIVVVKNYTHRRRIKRSLEYLRDILSQVERREEEYTKRLIQTPEINSGEMEN